MVAQVCDYTKIHKLHIFEKVNFMVYEIYLSETYKNDWSHPVILINLFFAMSLPYSKNIISRELNWAPKSLQMVTAAMKLKDAYSFEGKLWPT